MGGYSRTLRRRLRTVAACTSPPVGKDWYAAVRKRRARARGNGGCARRQRDEAVRGIRTDEAPVHAYRRRTARTPLSLVPERDRRFKRRRYGPTQLLGVDLRGLILDWAAGRDLVELADTYLAEVEGGDEDAFGFEQLSGFLAKVCEHHLP